MGQRYIGVYQRPAPPKRPLRLSLPRTIQKPPIPMHEIEAQARAMMENIAPRRKPGRPSINEQPMTPAERQARRRKSQSRERAIQEALQIGDAHGKSHGEVRSGGYDSQKLDTIQGLRDVEGREDSGATIGGRHVRAAEGESSAADEQTTDEILNSGESAAHRAGFEENAVQRIRLRGLGIGDEECNRRRFTEIELKKMVEQYFTSPAEKTPSARWIAKHVGNISVQRHERPSITLTCKLCADSMEFIEDAQDHLRVDHRDTIDEWFKSLVPRREFRDMVSFVTVVMPRKCRKPRNSESYGRLRTA
jgi:hypothetical protein